MPIALAPYTDTSEEVQLLMPGMPSPLDAGTAVDAGQLRSGQTVFYNGSLPGGPRRGARGVVRGTLRRQAVVDLGNLGIWYIPYYFLSAPSKAA